MSSVLQTLIHNPFLKRYYLSGSHLNCSKSHSECLSCCLNDIYQDFFTNPAIIGYGLTSFIEAAWKVKRSLAGYSEQDAHEFWQFLIHQIHKNDTTSSKYIKNKENTPSFENNKNKSQHFNSNYSNCDCIIHKIFSGTLLSTLTCTVCGKSRKIEDPMLDVSLEIQDKLENEKISLIDLQSCFDKYTRVEELDVLYDCSSCNKKTKVTKSLLLNKLPPVLSIQLKRFEHFGVSSKIDYHINIPMVLDVKNYVSNLNYENQITNYELFGIVCHLGNVNTGHYLAYVKNISGIWFKFDDATITRVSEADVKKVNGYMLFYCIKESN
jgi:ubiquitin carboxyl-terminal hydrolase 22/27/51